MDSSQLDWTGTQLGLSALIFVAGGIVKGTLGVGLPLVVLPLLSLVIPTKLAIGLLVMPVLLSNTIQVVRLTASPFQTRRFSSLIAAQLISTVLAVFVSSKLTDDTLKKLIAGVIITAVFSMLFRPTATIHTNQEKWGGPIVGLIAGIIGGLTSLTGPIVITYLMGLKLQKDEFVKNISLIYLSGAIPMYIAMYWLGRFGIKEVLLSCMALLPMFTGMYAGNMLRGILSEEIFRKILMLFLVLISALVFMK